MADKEPFAGMAQEETVQRLAQLMLELVNAAGSPAAFDVALNRIRQTAIIESGTVSTVANLTTAGNLVNIDSRNGSMLINALDDMAWSCSVREKIT